ncbi:MAG: VCBS repeat-containing protein, partial [Chitinophagaceae bacterium]|nr:VCBS repeat-containing protein [Chitinophagaceae bacterium]
MKLICASGIAILGFLFLPSCKEENQNKAPLTPNQEMAQLLDSIYRQNEVPNNVFSVTAVRAYYDSLFSAPEASPTMRDEYGRALAYLNIGEEKKAVEYLQSLLDKIPESMVEKRGQILKDMAIAWMRLGERSNCISNHSGESCIFPVKGGGVHGDPMGSENAIKIYESILKNKPGDLEARWLLNIAYMTLGAYPDRVPKEYYLPMPDDTSSVVKPFVDAAMKTGLDVKNVSGTSIFDDFNNDGYLDLVTSCMDLRQGLHYFRNNGDGTFSDLSKVSGLDQLHGGLNIMHTDYNNDGFKDIFVTRGGWKAEYGREPKSLIQNNGDGTFTDVTKKSGLMSFYPCMTANWSDLNNDGWLDVIMGNEPNGKGQSPTQVFLNNKNGTFTEVTKICGIDIAEHVKGVNAGDYNNDGLTDIYIAALTGKKFLFKNNGINKDGIPLFTNVTKEAGITNTMGSFSTWFFDYDNDGYLDIFNFLYENSKPIAYYAGSISLGQPANNSGDALLYRNNHDGTFTEVSKKLGLNKMMYTMGSNFGDFDNDGYLDFYACTGNPDFSALYPNKLFRNIEGKYFEDVTGSARVGSIQKAHGTCFADVDNDGDLDLYIEQGGPLDGDAYQNAFFINPGQNNNHWIALSLKGVKANSLGV